MEKPQAHSLIKAKASIDLADNCGRTALFYACAASHSKASVVSMLLREPFNDDEPHPNGGGAAAATPHAAAIAAEGQGQRQLFCFNSHFGGSSDGTIYHRSREQPR
jgi:hypothetical protein